MYVGNIFIWHFFSGTSCSNTRHEQDRWGGEMWKDAHWGQQWGLQPVAPLLKSFIWWGKHSEMLWNERKVLSYFYVNCSINYYLHPVQADMFHKCVTICAPGWLHTELHMYMYGIHNLISVNKCLTLHNVNTSCKKSLSF